MSRKRDQRKGEQLRKAVGAPPRVFAGKGAIVRCLINANWRENGMAVLHVLVRSANDGHAAATFLIDPWCLGLKDADGNLHTSTEEFNILMDWVAQDGVELVTIEPAAARRLVAAGIRFARENGFHLPDRYERWTALLGDIGDPMTADLSDFTHEGLVYYQGPRADLARRLVRGTVEDFLNRPNVDADFFEDEDSDDALNVSEPVAEAMLRDSVLSQIEAACASRGECVDPHLQEAWLAVFEEIAAAGRVAVHPGDAGDSGLRSRELPEMDDDHAADRAEIDLDDEKYSNAKRQISAFLQSIKSPDALVSTLLRDLKGVR